MRRPAGTRALLLAAALALGVALPAVAGSKGERRARKAPPPDIVSRAVTLSVSRVDLSAMLLRALDSLNAGGLDAADAGYAQVLDVDSRCADALHGLAAVALRRGLSDRAAELYLRAIDADPRDPVAQAGLAALRGASDPVATASRLKLLLAAQPGQHALHFALGNLHAAAGRWPEAHQDFVAAQRGDPTQPDYLFNLAVSLDQTHRPQQAAQYYRQALGAADKRLAAFERAEAAARLRELEPAEADSGAGAR